jgi:hypothetical protein
MLSESALDPVPPLLGRDLQKIDMLQSKIRLRILVGNVIKASRWYLIQFAAATRHNHFFRVSPLRPAFSARNTAKKSKNCLINTII